MLVSDVPCTAAGLFTQSTVPGAPVVISRKQLQDGRAQGIVANAGVANVATGEQGLADAREMARLAAERLGIDAGDMLVASTGVIGHRLPMEKIRNGIRSVEPRSDGGLQLAEAIMTTDSVRKSAAVDFESNGRRYSVGGIAKGSGMIHPDMATMFAFMTTDAPLEPSYLRSCLADTTAASASI